MNAVSQQNLSIHPSSCIAEGFGPHVSLADAVADFA